MPLRAVGCLSILALLTVAVGCVDRRFVVSSNVPGAHVTVDGEHLGPAPLDSQYVYTGKREIRVSAPGYEPSNQLVKFEPKWYDYPGLDLFAEVIWPFRIEDVRRVHVDLQPAQPVNIPELQAKADVLRSRTSMLPPPSVPDVQADPPKPQTSGLIPDPLKKYFPPSGTTPIPPLSPGRFNGR